MEIQGPGKPQRPQQANESRRTSAGSASSAASSQRSPDAAEFSGLGKMLSNLSSIPDVRRARVEEVKALIRDGQYDTDDRLFTALQRLLDEIFGVGGGGEG